MAVARLTASGGAELCVNSDRVVCFWKHKTGPELMISAIRGGDNIQYSVEEEPKVVAQLLRNAAVPYQG
jgi:hypothetical protein